MRDFALGSDEISFTGCFSAKVRADGVGIISAGDELNAIRQFLPALFPVVL